MNKIKNTLRAVDYFNFRNHTSLYCIDKSLPPENKKWIAGIDIGFKNMGLCVWKDPTRINGYMPYIEWSSLLVNAKGEGYNEWEESKAFEMIYNWVDDRWESIFKHCDLVVVEKQMLPELPRSRNRHTKHEKSCHLIEHILSSVFRTYEAFGGPLCVVKAPMWWKNIAGIACKYNHKRNKKESINRFFELRSNHVFEAIGKNVEFDRTMSLEQIRKIISNEQKYAILEDVHLDGNDMLTSKWDDVADSYHIGRAAVTDYKNLMKEASKIRNYNYHHSNPLGVRVNTSDRIGKRKRLGSGEVVLSIPQQMELKEKREMFVKNKKSNKKKSS
jgi:hypothetical protein